MLPCPPISGPPFWWLGTSLGMLVFVLFFVTWGLLILALVLHIMVMMRRLNCPQDGKRRLFSKKKKK
ncbi:hypothetical protein ACFL26_01175 [Patescibacteria group bacterium]